MNSMVPALQDWRDFLAHQRWFFGKGPRPQFDRWTYWERFDYFAVFWGVAIIGGTGLMLWFPEIFTRVFPGWMVNEATTIHSDEALLAVSFIRVRVTGLEKLDPRANYVFVANHASFMDIPAILARLPHQFPSRYPARHRKWPPSRPAPRCSPLRPKRYARLP